MKKLSIITINYNNAQGLERTIKSVACQYCKSDIEYIVVDGGSTDGSLEVIKKLEREIDYYISEPDKGIYNAMNKGIKFSHGECCLFLNSGECLLSSTSISQVFPLIPRNIDIFSFKNPNLKHSWCFQENAISFYYVYRYSLWHSNTFIKRELLVRLGGYNESFRIVSDWEFFLKALFIEGCTIAFFSTQIAQNEPDGISAHEMKLHMAERKKVTDMYFSGISIDCMELAKYKNSRLISLYDRIIKVIKCV